jgi:hypothetical protein
VRTHRHGTQCQPEYTPCSPDLSNTKRRYAAISFHVGHAFAPSSAPTVQYCIKEAALESERRARGEGWHGALPGAVHREGGQDSHAVARVLSLVGADKAQQVISFQELARGSVGEVVRAPTGNVFGKGLERCTFLVLALGTRVGAG